MAVNGGVNELNSIPVLDEEPERLLRMEEIAAPEQHADMGNMSRDERIAYISDLLEESERRDRKIAQNVRRIKWLAVAVIILTLIAVSALILQSVTWAVR